MLFRSEAARIISIAETTSELLGTVFNKWSKVRVTDKEIKKLIQLAMSPTKEVFKAIATENKAFEYSRQFTEVVGEVYSYAMNSPTQQMETTEGTLFGAYNSITGYYQNVNSYKDESSKLNSILYGTGLERSKKAFEICLAADDFLN